jgi:hypothetical protein
MVSVNLKGGLGNMLFQIAFIEDLARRGGFEVRYPDIDEVFTKLSHAGHSDNCYDYLKIFKNFDWRKNQDKPMPTRFCSFPNKYIDITPTDDILYDGYFQSDKYFDRDFVLELFEPADFIKKKLPKWNTKGVISVHVRRGDFLDPKDLQFNLEMDYYFKAMGMVLDISGDDSETLSVLKKVHTFLVFSDDYKWCKEKLTDYNVTFFEDINDPVNYMELFWMSMCEHNIIANSSFSWWGAYLNQNPDKVVIAPMKWLKSGEEMSDVYTSRMIKI